MRLSRNRRCRLMSTIQQTMATTDNLIMIGKIQVLHQRSLDTYPLAEIRFEPGYWNDTMAVEIYTTPSKA
jgi:hypothetical protein